VDAIPWGDIRNRCSWKIEMKSITRLHSFTSGFSVNLEGCANKSDIDQWRRCGVVVTGMRRAEAEGTFNRQNFWTGFDTSTKPHVTTQYEESTWSAGMILCKTPNKYAC
jgi:hypothetical protein